MARGHLAVRGLDGSGIALLACVMLLPFLWMLGTSLMDELGVFRMPPPLIPATSFGGYS